MSKDREPNGLVDCPTPTLPIEPKKSKIDQYIKSFTTIVDKLPAPSKRAARIATISLALFGPTVALADNGGAVALNGIGWTDSANLLHPRPDQQCLTGSYADFYLSGYTAGSNVTEKVTQSNLVDCNGNKVVVSGPAPYAIPGVFDSNGNLSVAIPVEGQGSVTRCFDDNTQKEGCIDYVLTPGSALTSNSNLSRNPITPITYSSPLSTLSNVNIAPQTGSQSVDVGPGASPTAIVTADSKYSTPTPVTNNSTTPVTVPTPDNKHGLPFVNNFTDTQDIATVKQWVSLINKFGAGVPSMQPDDLSFLTKTYPGMILPSVISRTSSISDIMANATVNKGIPPGCGAACYYNGQVFISSFELQLPPGVVIPDGTLVLFKELATRATDLAYPNSPPGALETIPTAEAKVLALNMQAGGIILPPQTIHALDETISNPGYWANISAPSPIHTS